MIFNNIQLDIALISHSQFTKISDRNHPRIRTFPIGLKGGVPGQCDLTNATIYDQITMKSFDNDNGGYNCLEYVDLSFNDNLNVSINFLYLDGQTYLYYLNFLQTDRYIEICRF